MEAAGYDFTVVPPSDGAEPELTESSPLAGLSPAELVAELARLKGEDVAARITEQSSRDPALVLAADTVAECGGRILGKPRDEADAREMLTWMSGREHRVLTGVCLIAVGDKESLPQPATIEVVATQLRMAPLEDDWLGPYVASGGWRGKAGAFGYQDGLAFVSISRGSESNVVGLPMERVAELLAQHGCLPQRPDQS